MKVSKEKSSFKVGSAIKYLLTIGVLFILIQWGFDFLNRTSRSDLEKEFYCDAEYVSGGNFVTDGIEFSSGSSQSSEDAYTGKYSSRCNANQMYGMTLSLPAVRALDTISISVAIKCVNANARVVVSSGTNKYFEFTTVKSDQSGWELVDYEVILPIGYVAGDTKVYAYFTDGGGHIFVDDMNVSVGIYDQSLTIEEYDGELLRIKLTNDNYERIKLKRGTALEQGLLFSSKDDLVDGDIRIDEKSYSAKLRLKGDLLDHLKGDKWSFRIQLKNGEEWKGMKNFSIHNSMARSHISEWVMHRLFKDEGIMTPAYDFMNVELNEGALGIYAYEQHFDNQLLKYNNRLVGPILKHNDDAYWENVQKYLNPFPWIDASYIELFNKENGKDENFAMLFEMGKSMLNDFLNEQKTASEIFDLDKLTTYYALLDLSHSLHAQIFTNIRFYLDPISGKLEPIGFDCFGSEVEHVTPGWNAVGEGVNERYADRPENNLENIYQYHLLKDPDFFQLYMKKIYHYSSPKFLKEKQIEYGREINERELFIRSDSSYSTYKFSWDHLFRKAEFTRNKLYPKDNMSLRVYRSPKGKQFADVQSYHLFPMEVIGTADKLNNVDSLTIPIRLEAYNEYIPVKTYEINASNNINSIVYRVLGAQNEYTTPVIKSNIPLSNIDVVRADINSLSDIPFITLSDRIVTIASGRNVLTKPIVIPKEYTLNISPGTEMIFSGGSILSYGPIKAIGSEQQKIIFKSDGRPASGILISDVSNQSIFEHCAFSNLGNYRYKNIFTNGSVNIYRSNAIFSNCVFTGATSRECLSLVYSEVDMKNCLSINSKGDAIMSKYSSLTINDIELKDIGRNAINITGGSMMGDGVLISNAFIRAIKGADRLLGNLKNVIIRECEIGITLSYNSDLTIANCTLEKITNGMLIKGKSEKGSKLVLSNYNRLEVKNEYKVDIGSILKINGSTKK